MNQTDPLSLAVLICVYAPSGHVYDPNEEIGPPGGNRPQREPGQVASENCQSVHRWISTSQSIESLSVAVLIQRYVGAAGRRH